MMVGCSDNKRTFEEFYILFKKCLFSWNNNQKQNTATENLSLKAEMVFKRLPKYKFAFKFDTPWF